MKTPKIVGDSWELWVEDSHTGWKFLGHPFSIYEMIDKEFPCERLIDEYDEKHIITWGTKFGPLWKDVLTFIKQKGIKARGIALPKMQGERGPSD
jgi:hypothetical protein